MRPSSLPLAIADRRQMTCELDEIGLLQKVAEERAVGADQPAAARAHEQELLGRPRRGVRP